MFLSVKCPYLKIVSKHYESFCAVAELLNPYFQNKESYFKREKCKTVQYNLDNPN